MALRQRDDSGHIHIFTYCLQICKMPVLLSKQTLYVLIRVTIQLNRLMYCVEVLCIRGIA